MLLEELGRGSYGRVYLCERRVGDGVATPWRRFAMKVMNKPRLRRLSEYVNVPSGGMRKVTAEDKVRAFFSWVSTWFIRAVRALPCRPYVAATTSVCLCAGVFSRHPVFLIPIGPCQTHRLRS